MSDILKQLQLVLFWFLKQNTLPIIQVSQKWRTNYLLPYPGGLNVHKKKYGKKISDKKINYYYFYY
jgi:hypothetical protein